MCVCGGGGGGGREVDPHVACQILELYCHWEMAMSPVDFRKWLCCMLLYFLGSYFVRTKHKQFTQEVTDAIFNDYGC